MVTLNSVSEWSTVHICQPEHAGTEGMKALYNKLHIIPTSTAGDTILIRSHIAYWSGSKAADRAAIAPSRGHSYRVNKETIVKIVNYYDHREGVTGWK